MNLKTVRGLSVVWKEPKGKTESSTFMVNRVIETRDGKVLFKIEKRKSIPAVENINMEKYRLGWKAGKLLEDEMTVSFFERAKKGKKHPDGWKFLDSYKFLDVEKKGGRIHYMKLQTLSREWLMEKAKTITLYGTGDESVTLEMPKSKTA
jgi:hypothetical protein